MKTLLLYIGFVCVLAGLPLVSSAAPAETTSIPNKPAAVTERNTPIAVDFEGTDSIGSRLATALKERFNASNLFTLTDKDTPKIRVLLATTPEFSTRPEVGSAYCVVWLFSQSEATLRHFLLREVGVLSPGDVNDLAARIVERTDGLSVRYGYLFQ